MNAALVNPVIVQMNAFMATPTCFACVQLIYASEKYSAEKFTRSCTIGVIYP